MNRHAKPLLPTQFEVISPHGYEGKDNLDTTSSCEERRCAKSKLVWCGNNIDVVPGAFPQGRERAFLYGACEAAGGVVLEPRRIR